VEIPEGYFGRETVTLEGPHSVRTLQGH